MTILSQRDIKWANETLGTKGTIGAYGCTITSIAMLLGKTPSEVNQAIKSVSGYSDGNLVIWSKLPIAFSKIKSATRVFGYDNDQVKQAVEKNGGCLVEVDGSRIGATKHWVLYIGGGQMYDPWYGTQKTTSYYPPTGFSIIEIDKTPVSSETIQVLKSDFENLVTKSTKFDAFVEAGFPDPQSVKLSVETYTDRINTLKNGFDEFLREMVGILDPNTIIEVADQDLVKNLAKKVVSDFSVIQSELLKKEKEWQKTEVSLENENLELEKQVISLKEEVERLLKRVLQVETDLQNYKDKKDEQVKKLSFIEFIKKLFERKL